MGSLKNKRCLIFLTKVLIGFTILSSDCFATKVVGYYSRLDNLQYGVIVKVKGFKEVPRPISSNIQDMLASRSKGRELSKFLNSSEGKIFEIQLEVLKVLKEGSWEEDYKYSKYGLSYIAIKYSKREKSFNKNYYVFNFSDSFSAKFNIDIGDVIFLDKFANGNTSLNCVSGSCRIEYSNHTTSLEYILMQYFEKNYDFLKKVSNLSFFRRYLVKNTSCFLDFKHDKFKNFFCDGKYSNLYDDSLLRRLFYDDEVSKKKLSYKDSFVGLDDLDSWLFAKEIKVKSENLEKSVHSILKDIGIDNNKCDLKFEPLLKHNVIHFKAGKSGFFLLSISSKPEDTTIKLIPRNIYPTKYDFLINTGLINWKSDIAEVDCE